VEHYDDGFGMYEDQVLEDDLSEGELPTLFTEFQLEHSLCPFLDHQEEEIEFVVVTVTVK